MTPTYTLYEWPPTRSHRVRWTFEELGVAFSSELVNLTEKHQDTAAYRAIHPLGAVPALSSPDYTIFESVAIVLQLIDEHPSCGLAPKVGTPARASYYQWCCFAGTEVDPAIMMYFDYLLRPSEARHPPGAPDDLKLAAIGQNQFNQRARIISDALEARPFILGEQFSGADILIGHSCVMATFTGLIEEHAGLSTYLDRLRQRPAFQRSYADYLNLEG